MSETQKKVGAKENSVGRALLYFANHRQQRIALENKKKESNKGEYNNGREKAQKEMEIL